MCKRNEIRLIDVLSFLGGAGVVILRMKMWCEKQLLVSGGGSMASASTGGSVLAQFSATGD